MATRAQEKLTSLVPPATPSEGLQAAVLKRVEAYRTASARHHLAFDVVVALASSVCFVLTARLFLREAAASGAFQYLSMLFTNGTAALAYWRETLSSFAEAFPAFLAAATVATVVVMLTSLQRAIVNGASVALHRRHFASQ